MELLHSRTDEITDAKALPVFWTGGWDSTFRVFDLVVHYGIPVQPIYVVDKSRRSWKIELQVLERIRTQFEADFPDRTDLLLPTIQLDAAELGDPVNKYRSYLDLADRIGGSKQYAYLAYVSENTGFPKIEISIQGGDESVTFQFLRERVKEVQLEHGANTYELNPWEPTSEFERSMLVFATFRFPLLFTHPKELEKVAEAHGIASLLDSTWTCHRPILGAPCGVCGVCRIAIEAGKTRHFPKSSLIRYRFHPVLSPLWVMVVNPKGGLKKIASLLRRRS